jgi:hypothetical protein
LSVCTPGTPSKSRAAQDCRVRRQPRNEHATALARRLSGVVDAQAGRAGFGHGAHARKARSVVARGAEIVDQEREPHDRRARIRLHGRLQVEQLAGQEARDDGIGRAEENSSLGGVRRVTWPAPAVMETTPSAMSASVADERRIAVVRRIGNLL